MAKNMMSKEIGMMIKDTNKMSVNELIRVIYDFDGTSDEWLEFERKVYNIIDGYSEEENEELTESEAMEVLSMVCEGIRYEREKL